MGTIPVGGLASGGDATGDGALDILVESPDAFPGGAVALVKSDGKLEWQVTARGSGFEFGSSLASVSNCRRRGQPTEFLVGAPGYSRDSGGAYLISNTGQVLETILGKRKRARFGETVATVPDSSGSGGPVMATAESQLGNGLSRLPETLFLKRGKIP